MITPKVIISCPLEPHYHFYNDCKIDCLYSSSKCKHNCIQLGTNQTGDSKTLSSSEILFYKSSEISGLDVKTINVMKKEAITRIQNLYAFNYFLEFARNNYYDLRLNLQSSCFYLNMVSSRIQNLLNRYPYNIPIFKIKEEDLVLLLTQSIFEDFRTKKRLSVETSYEGVLCLSEVKIQKARRVLSKYLKPKEIYHEFSKEED